jgi:hypothetical protein
VLKERRGFCKSVGVQRPIREKRTPVITDPIEINQRYVKLPEVVLLGIDDPEE